MSTHPLIELARRSIAYGLEHGRPLPVSVEEYPEPWQKRRATFVTLNKRGRLRGCIGNLQAIQPLVVDVAENAFNAAFRDPRFPPVERSELDRLDIHISLLGTPEPLAAQSEAELLQSLEPGKDGLIIEAQGHRATFLPSVWEQLPRPEDFLLQLKRKAGLAEHGWPRGMRAWRYRVEEIDSASLENANHMSR
ncbi:MAG: AmmeMemoRadiSam system protein A [Acidithiobacillus caldus]|jgi:AmmeMemoRadiSam system protein A|uniref:AMMECR1 domain-containing protein n=1 Tax=Acidithiobacillus caldus TaxID=33059 RepID=A0A1E7YK84_9PROT|nr:AmmeMemoRadiSam system protein A [Acidithiobacillus caldus]MBU2781717.1 AmmeMemoRadiSam system protein A [Acidithiobacillus caldus]MBU2791266.1 AmmeMemoRadiSam system protein A [Acidithiobacillus caldus]MBU2821171.1 AmmeMemoRadiSam system protein A [Acidithiobacillus caldus]OFC29969.1 AMMECR1 domain-containing protein [Acidithiobacillus caldus]OFC36882.1 AMMECR1 domain-containing protein [Acidithiobacillus caldus]